MEKVCRKSRAVGNTTPLETVEQQAVVQWLLYRHLIFFAVPNGSFRNKREAARLQREGVQSGVPDLLILNMPPAQPQLKGTFVEMKRRRGGKLSQSQVEWRTKVLAQGYMWIQGNGYDHTIQQLEALGY
jgi:hypothetical protein